MSNVCSVKVDETTSKPSRGSTQQINHLRFKLRGVVSPIAVDFPRVRPERATRFCTPGMDRVVRVREFVIAAYVRDYGNLACRSLCTNHLAFALKGSDDLNAEIN